MWPATTLRSFVHCVNSKPLELIQKLLRAVATILMQKKNTTNYEIIVGVLDTATEWLATMNGKPKRRPRWSNLTVRQLLNELLLVFC